MILIAADQKKKYLCILSKKNVLKCFKINDLKKTSILFKKNFYKKEVNFLQIKSFAKVINIRNFKAKKSIDVLYICLYVTINQVKLLDTSKKRIISVYIKDEIKSVSISIIFDNWACTDLILSKDTLGDLDQLFAPPLAKVPLAVI